MTPNGYEEFQREYEAESDREYKRLAAKPVAKLLEQVRSAKFTDNYQLWHVIGDKASLQLAGWILFDVLSSTADYLNRYHCAAALIKLGGAPLAAYTPVMLSAEKAQPVKQNLAAVEGVLRAMIGKKGH